jgi:hypothetical protein
MVKFASCFPLVFPASFDLIWLNGFRTDFQMIFLVKISLICIFFVKGGFDSNWPSRFVENIFEKVYDDKWMTDAK